MDSDTKRVLGRLLGEIYRLQKRQDPEMVPVNDGDIFALIHGFDWALESVLYDTSFVPVTIQEHDAFRDLLERYEDNPSKMADPDWGIEFKREFNDLNIESHSASLLVAYFRAQGSHAKFLDALDKARHVPSQLLGMRPKSTDI